MKRLRESGTISHIRKIVESGCIYIGVSAGSIVAGPEITIASLGDENDVKLEDFSGIGLTDTIITPHYEQKEEEQIKEMEKRISKDIVRIADNEALLITNSKTELIK